jgi:hypothetical protein
MVHGARAIGAAWLALAGAAASAQVVTTSFQNGTNGYNGTFDRRISDRSTDETLGSDSAAFFLDGFAPGTSPSPDTQGLIRFDGIIGAGPGQIPANATILRAKLTLATSLASNADTSGPFGVSGLNQAFDASTSYFTSFTSTTDFGSRGPWWQDGSATRPVGGFGFQIPGGVDSANVIPLVQSWANGSPNYGMVIQAGTNETVAATANTADGWSIATTGFPYSDIRPKLEVDYTVNPVTRRVFQRGLNAYQGDTMAIVRSGVNALIADPDTERTEDAAALDQTFLDGVFFTKQDGTTNSPDDFALLKFTDVFGSGASQASPDVPVAKAWLVLTTGNLSTGAHSSGPWAAHAMLRPWDVSSLHSTFGAVNGLQVGDGDIGPALDELDGFIRGAEAWFDVTSYLEGVRGGKTDHGIAVKSGATADGWQIHANGSAVPEARPRLVVLSGDLSIVGPDPGDFNDDGVVDGLDLLAWQRQAGGAFDGADLAQWESQFGTAGGARVTAVPEPAGIVGLGLLATVAATVRRRR